MLTYDSLSIQIFDCDYLRETIRYEHNGSPFLSEDTVKLVAYRILENKTEQVKAFLLFST